MIDWKKMFAKWKYHYDISASFLGLINFFLLSITASTPIQDFLLARLGLKLDQFLIVGLLCAMLVVVFLLFGFALDKIFLYWENMMTIQNSKNPQITEILENTRKILRRR
jgi:uncharacterized protein YneF (UPF0154 family)